MEAHLALMAQLSRSSLIDRRAMLGLTGCAAIGLLLFGRSGDASPGLRFGVNHTYLTRA